MAIIEYAGGGEESRREGRRKKRAREGAGENRREEEEAKELEACREEVKQAAPKETKPRASRAQTQKTPERAG